MKTLTAALAALVLACPAVHAASAAPAGFSLAMSADPIVAPSDLNLQVPADTSDVVTSSPISDSSSHFAQFDTPAKSLPVSPRMVFAFIALFIVALRLLAVRQAHAMAENEIQSHRRRAQMFRDLHEQRAGRR